MSRCLNQPHAAPADTMAPMLSPRNRASSLAPNHVQEVHLHHVESISDLHSGGKPGREQNTAIGRGKKVHPPTALLMAHSPCRLTAPLPGRGGTAMGRAAGHPATITMCPVRLRPYAQPRGLPAATCTAGVHLPGACHLGRLPERYGGARSQWGPRAWKWDQEALLCGWRKQLQRLSL